jgi:hypothetical protein
MADFLNRTGGDGGGSPGRRERGRMRRRLRQQQRVREALLLDLGALVYELHRQGRREPELLQAKAAELLAVDDEVRALGEALHERQPLAQLVAAGIAGSCPTCGALLTSDARFCSSCGSPTGGELAEPKHREPEIAPASDGSPTAGDDMPPWALEPDEDAAEELVTGEVTAGWGAGDLEPEAAPPPEAEASPDPEPTAPEEPGPEPAAEEPVPAADEPLPEAEPTPTPAETVARESPPEPTTAGEAAPTGSWAHDVGTRGPQGPPPRPGPPPQGYEPIVDRAVKLAQQGLRSGRDWLRKRRS